MGRLSLSVLLLLLFLPENAVFAAPFQKDDAAYLCFKHSLQHRWPEVFAYQVEIIDLYHQRFKVKVVDSFPMEGRENEEQTPVKGDVMKISKQRVYSKAEAGVMPGDRFDGKPVCKNFM